MHMMSSGSTTSGSMGDSASAAAKDTLKKKTPPQ